MSVAFASAVIQAIPAVVSAAHLKTLLTGLVGLAAAAVIAGAHD